ncbi:MAG TPA: rhodanese-like domain-containing protein [Bryobacteraceae bacterium]|nr:rhodanese-like domain-containing protein [Bryobacteraceae bacterium]
MMRRCFFVLLFSALGGLCAHSPVPLTMAQVEAILGKSGVYVFDVNTPELWERAHLPGAIFVDQPDLRKFLPRDKKATLVFYCANRICTGGSAAAQEALRLGYRNAFVMPEGIFGWVGSGRPTERGRASPSR